MAQATLPLVLLSLGIQLGAAGRLSITFTSPMLFATGVRSLLLGLLGQPLAVLVLSASMPTAVNALLLTTLGAVVTAVVAGLPYLP